MTRLKPLPVSPLRAWRTKQGLQYEQVAKLVSALVDREGGITPRFIQCLETGYRRPGFNVANALVTISNHAFTLEALMRFKDELDAARSRKRSAA